MSCSYCAFFTSPGVVSIINTEFPAGYYFDFFILGNISHFSGGTVSTPISTHKLNLNKLNFKQKPGQGRDQTSPRGYTHVR